MAKKAFLVGIDTMGLNCCCNDAILMQECLEKRGYEVVMLNKKQEKWAILKEFEKFLDDSDIPDTIIFYFSGHGVIPGGKLFLVIGDNDYKVKNKIKINNITDPLENCKAENKLIILDCCHAGRANVDWKPDPSDAYRILLASSPFGTTKVLDSLHASFLTHRLHQALTAPSAEIVDHNRRICINDLSKWIRGEAKRYNAIEDSKKVAIPYLIGNDKYNFEIADITQEEIKKLHLLNADSTLSNQCPMVQSARNHSIQNGKKYMDQVTSINDFDIISLNRFRDRLRTDTLESYPGNLSHEEFLTKANLLVNGYLTRTGVLLFGNNPTDVCRSAVTQCYKYYGEDKTAERDRKQLRLTITDQIFACHNFIASNIKKVETLVPDRADSQVKYEYPMLCVREIIANALAHRNYEDDRDFVHITLFSNRIEVISPGNWFGKALIEGQTYKLDELESASIKRNIALADVLSWIFLVEGEGSGIPKAIYECKELDAPIPDVVQRDGFITVTIWPIRNFQAFLGKSNASIIVPHQIQPPPRDFKGREEEIRDILSNFEKGATITGLRGMGGIGKTTLALVLAEKLKDRFPDGQIFIDMRGTSRNPELPPLTPVEAMAQVIHAYNPVDRLPESPVELHGLNLSILAEKRVLLLLDNAAGSEQVEPLLPPEGCSVLITSRIRFALPGLAAKDLDILPSDKASELLLEIAPRIGNRADELAKLCGYLPLALRNAARALAEKTDLNVSEYEQHLRDKAERLELAKASFSLSYDLLTPRRKKQWLRLSVFREDFDRNAAIAVLKMAPGASAEALSDLVRWSLIDFVPMPDSNGGRYKLHDLARLFAESCLKQDELADAQQKHAKYYSRVLSRSDNLYKKGGINLLEGLELFDREWANIKVGQAYVKNIIRSTGNLKKNDLKSVLQLARAYADEGVNVLDLRLNPTDLIEWLETGLKAARMMRDRRAEGIHLVYLGNAHSTLGEIRKAIEYYEQALKISREIGDRRNEGGCLGNMGLAYADLGETRKAIEYHEQALRISREIGDRRSEGFALGNMGLAYADLGETRKAIEYYEQALKISREIGDRRGEGNRLSNLGLAYADFGETRKAIEYHGQALAITREIGYRGGEGAALGNLGSAYAALGETSKTIEYHDYALAINREIGNRRSEGSDLGNLGLAYADLGETRKAIEYYEKALAISREIEDRLIEGENLCNLGKVYADLGENNKAIGYCDQALEILRNMEYRRGEADALFNKSLALNDLGEQQNAIDRTREALDIFEQIESPRAEKVRQKLTEWQSSGEPEN